MENSPCFLAFTSLEESYFCNSCTHFLLIKSYPITPTPSLPAPLPKVENLTISDVTPYGFRVSWEVRQREKLAPHGGGFSHFHIVVTDSGWLLEPQEFTVPGNRSHLDIWGLITGIGYDVRLTGVTESGLLSRPLTTVAVTGITRGSLQGPAVRFLIWSCCFWDPDVKFHCQTWNKKPETLFLKTSLMVRCHVLKMKLCSVLLFNPNISPEWPYVFFLVSFFSLWCSCFHVQESGTLIFFPPKYEQANRFVSIFLVCFPSLPLVTCRRNSTVLLLAPAATRVPRKSNVLAGKHWNRQIYWAWNICWFLLFFFWCVFWALNGLEELALSGSVTDMNFGKAFSLGAEMLLCSGLNWFSLMCLKHGGLEMVDKKL